MTHTKFNFHIPKHCHFTLSAHNQLFMCINKQEFENQKYGQLRAA